MTLEQIQTAVSQKANAGELWQNQSLSTKWLRLIQGGGAALSTGNTNVDTEIAWVKDLEDSINALS